MQPVTISHMAERVPPPKQDAGATPVETEERVALFLQRVPVEAGHLSVVAVPVVVAAPRLRVLIACAQSSHHPQHAMLANCPALVHQMPIRRSYRQEQESNRDLSHELGLGLPPFAPEETHEEQQAAA